MFNDTTRASPVTNTVRNDHERIVMRGIVLRNGLAFMQSNKTGYDESRFMHLVCPVCGTRFHRPPSHVARNKDHTTCSRGCASEARKVRIETHCVICGEGMELIPSMIEKKTTCSKQCSTLRRVKDIKTVRKSSLGAYKRIALEISNRGKCENCCTQTGPWVVRGLKATVAATGEVIIDKSATHLWCRHCHLSSVAQSGYFGRIRSRGH